MQFNQNRTTKKIKVLQLPIADSKGGITNYVLQNWRFIDRDQFQFDFATRSPVLSFSENLINSGCKIHYLSCSSEENENQFINEINKILDENYDIIHLHTSYWKGLLVEQIAMERNVPMVIIHAHSTMVDIADELKRENAIKKHMAIKNEVTMLDGTHFWACSVEASDWLFGGGISKDRIEIIPNAIDIEEFKFSPIKRKKIRQDLHLDNYRVIGHIGRFCYQKNHQFLIEVFRRVHSQDPQTRLLLVGDGPLADNIDKQIKEYGLENSIIMLGYRSDVSDLLSAMDIFLLPSLFEGLGMVLLEAQANQLNCFVSSFVPKEAELSPFIHYLDLECDYWVNAIIQFNWNKRSECKEQIVDLPGYSLKSQIKEIEKKYGIGILGV